MLYNITICSRIGTLLLLYQKGSLGGYTPEVLFSIKAFFTANAKKRRIFSKRKYAQTNKRKYDR